MEFLLKCKKNHSDPETLKIQNGIFNDESSFKMADTDSKKTPLLPAVVNPQTMWRNIIDEQPGAG